MEGFVRVFVILSAAKDPVRLATLLRDFSPAVRNDRTRCVILRNPAMTGRREPVRQLVEIPLDFLIPYGILRPFSPQNDKATKKS